MKCKKRPKPFSFTCVKTRDSLYGCVQTLPCGSPSLPRLRGLQLHPGLVALRELDAGRFEGTTGTTGSIGPSTGGSLSPETTRQQNNRDRALDRSLLGGSGICQGC